MHALCRCVGAFINPTQNRVWRCSPRKPPRPEHICAAPSADRQIQMYGPTWWHPTEHVLGTNGSGYRRMSGLCAEGPAERPARRFGSGVPFSAPPPRGGGTPRPRVRGGASSTSARTGRSAAAAAAAAAPAAVAVKAAGPGGAAAEVRRAQSRVWKEAPLVTTGSYEFVLRSVLSLCRARGTHQRPSPCRRHVDPRARTTTLRSARVR